MNIYNKFIFILVSTIVLYTVFLIFADLKLVYEKINTMNMAYLPIIVLLPPCSWLILFIRWHILLKNSGICISMKESLKINLAGYALSMTPGKVGELFKAHFIKTRFGVPQKNTMPIVIVEQFYTLLGLTCVGLFGISHFQFGFYVMGITVMALVFAFLVLSSHSVFHKFSKVLSKIPFLSKYTESFLDSHSVIKKSFDRRVFVYCAILSILFWIIECIVVYFVILSFGLDSLELFQVASMYGTSIILGVVSFLPLGIGVVEGSLTGFLILEHINVSLALTLVIVIRIFTRWYGVSVGLISLKLIGGFSIKNNNSTV